MNKSKKIIVLIIFIIILCGIFFAWWYFTKSKSNELQEVNNVSVDANENNNTQKNDNVSNENQNEVKEENENVNTSTKKVAVVYFSATGTTKTVTEYIKEETNGDIFEIIPKQKYSSADLNWNDSSSRSTKEQNDKNARPEIENNIDVSNYDVIFIGYPIWWADTPRIIQTFMDSHNLSGKTMIPFCTSGGTGISTSEKTLKTYSGINWISGRRLGTSKNEVVNWVKSLNY